MGDDSLTDKQQTIVNNLPSDKYDLADTVDLAPSTVRDHIKSIRETGIDIEWHPHREVYVKGGIDVRKTADEISHDTVTTILQDSGATYKQLQEELGTTKDVLKTVFDDMREKGYSIEFDVVDGEGTRHFYIPDDIDRRYKIADGDGHYTFAIISDTHLGSEAEHLEELHDFYDRCVDRGISRVFHCGDISDGWDVHQGHVNVVKGEATGWDRLKEYVVQHYPKRDGITTHFIEGNHDHKYHRRNGIHFGELIANEREDLHYCGDSQATFIFDRENDIGLEVLHPSGGKPYTVGYRLQTLYRERSLKDRPTIAAVGHIHGSMYAETEGVKGLYAGAWKGTTTYGKRKGHEAKIGGWIIDMDIKDGVVTQFVPQWQGYEEQGTANSYEVEDIS